MPTHAKKRPSRTSQVSAAVIGNALEWYDYGIYGFFAATIAKVFFPADDPYLGLLLAFATFGVGFLMRPIGGIFIGAYADSKGRKKALELIIGLMGFSLVIIILTPSYERIGLAAPLLIVFSRLIQGAAAGGEFATATAFLVEIAPPDRKGLYGAWQMAGQTLASAAAMLVGLALTSFFTDEQLLSGYWRIPFIIGLVIVPVGVWIRLGLEDPEEFVQAKKQAVSEEATIRQGLLTVLRESPRAVIGTLFLTICATSVIYTIVVYMPTYLPGHFSITAQNTFLAGFIGTLATFVMEPLSGALSDKYGRKKILLVFLVPLVLILYPFFQYLQSAPSLGRLILVYTIISVFIGGFLGTFSTAMGEQFPTHVRSTGMAISYNLAVMVFGGFAGAIVTWLIHSTGLVLAPILFAIFGGVLGIIGALIIHDSKTRRAKLFG